MNMSQYQTPRSLPLNFERFFPASTEPLKCPPLMNTLPQILQRTPFPGFDSLHQSSHLLNKNSPPVDYIPGPTKRVRHTKQDYTENTFNPEEIPRLAQAGESANFLSNQQDFLKGMKDIRSHLAYRQHIFDMEEANSRKLYYLQSELPQNRGLKSMDFGGDLVIPPLTNENKASSIPEILELLKNGESAEFEAQKFFYQQAQKKALQQLAQQKAERDFQQRLLQQLERQQQNFESFVQQQFTQQIKQKKLQINENMHQLHEVQKLNQIAKPDHRGLNLTLSFSKNQPSQGSLMISERTTEEPNTSSTVDIPQLKDDEYQYIKTEAFYDDESSVGFDKNKKISAKKDEKKVKISQPSQKGVSQEKKKRRSQNYSDDYFGILGKNLVRKEKDEPRNRNKWQCKAAEMEPIVLPEEQKVEGQEEGASGEIENLVEKPIELILQKVPKVKPPKPVEIPQHMQDDSLIDYKQLFSITITNDPAVVGTNADANGFAVINNEFKTADMGEIGQETRVGARYQANIPELRERTKKGKKRCPELIWKPEMMKENDMKGYFEDLAKILKCDNVNEERALKLLKRKKFKKEKVKINITKNEKFYLSFLAVTEGMSDVVEGNIC